MSRTLLDVLVAGTPKSITREEFAEAVRSGDIARREAAIEAMLEAGGYENLESR